MLLLHPNSRNGILLCLFNFFLLSLLVVDKVILSFFVRFRKRYLEASELIYKLLLLFLFELLLSLLIELFELLFPFLGFLEFLKSLLLKVLFLLSLLFLFLFHLSFLILLAYDLLLSFLLCDFFSKRDLLEELLS